MKLNKDLRLELKKYPKLHYALDIGFGYPYELIEIHHILNADKCFGVDLKSIENSVSLSSIVNEISTYANIDENKIENLIRDNKPEREFHNSYKLYTSLVLGKEPLDFESYSKYLELHFSLTIQDYIKNHNKWIPYYDVIIISKILSHIDPYSEENSDWVLDELLKKLSKKGVIFLRLNSDDFKVEKHRGILDSTILAPFSLDRLNKVLEKLNVISKKIITRDDGKRVYEIVAKRNPKIYDQ